MLPAGHHPPPPPSSLRPSSPSARHPPRPSFSVCSRPPPTSIACTACTNAGRECVINFLQKTKSCAVCALLGENDQCVFPPSSRGMVGVINRTCRLCSSRQKPCRFRNLDDSKCIRCSDSDIDCVFLLSSEFVHASPPPLRHLPLTFDCHLILYLF